MTTPLYQQIADHMRARIVSGELPVGSRLEPNRELVDRYGVSVVTVNKALTLLVSEGLIYTRVGRGTFVARSPVAEPQGESGVIGFVVRDLKSPYFSLIVSAAHDRADAAGYGLLLASSSHAADKEEEQIRRLRSLGVDALVIVSMKRTYRASEAIRELHTENFPYVMVSYTEGDVPFIGTDLEQAGFLATRHLIEAGRERIGYISDRSGSMPSDLRRQGFRRALRQYGMLAAPALEFEYPLDGEWNDYWSGYAVGEQVAALGSRPDAMFVFNDLGAIGFQDALLDRGIRVPEEVAVVGVDDIEESARARVPLTTVRQPTDRIGALAVETLIQRLRGEQPELRQLLDPQLVVRESCGTQPAPDAEEAPLQTV